MQTQKKEKIYITHMYILDIYHYRKLSRERISRSSTEVTHNNLNYRDFTETDQNLIIFTGNLDFVTIEMMEIVENDLDHMKIQEIKNQMLMILSKKQYLITARNSIKQILNKL